MSKIFYDKFIILEEIELEIKQLELSAEEKKELEHLIDGMINHRVLDRILKHLPKEHHSEFLQKFHTAPFDPALIRYINHRIDTQIEEHIKDEMEKIKAEILEEIKHAKSIKSN